MSTNLASMTVKVTAVVALMALSNVSFAAKRISCKSFDNQAQAQSHYDARQRGWKSLDRDKDGEPCECLVGGSKAGKSICTRWRKKNNK